MTKKEKRNIRQEVTDKIVDALESGTAPRVHSQLADRPQERQQRNLPGQQSGHQGCGPHQRRQPRSCVRIR